MAEEEYDWKMLSMIKNKARNERIISKISDKKNWARKGQLTYDERFGTDMSGKIQKMKYALRDDKNRFITSICAINETDAWSKIKHQMGIRNQSHIFKLVRK